MSGVEWIGLHARSFSSGFWVQPIQFVDLHLSLFRSILKLALKKILDFLSEFFRKTHSAKCTYFWPIFPNELSRKCFQKMSIHAKTIFLESFLFGSCKFGRPQSLTCKPNWKKNFEAIDIDLDVRLAPNSGKKMLQNWVKCCMGQIFQFAHGFVRLSFLL